MTDKETDLLQTAKERLKKAYEADQVGRERMSNDFLFLIGEGQWREEDRMLREAAGKPCLTFNRMPQFLRKVTAQIRALNPAIRVSAADQSASPEIAEVMEGLIRQIEAQSDAAAVYEAAAETAAACSIGYWRILTKYCDGDTFDQDIFLEKIRNPFGVFLDPAAKDETRKDAQWGFIAEAMEVDDFKAQYPGKQVLDATGDSTPSGAVMWRQGDKVVVAEYYWIENEEYEIGLLATGEVLRDPKPPLDFVAKRTVKRPRVKWAKISGAEVLEGPQDVPGRHIPIVAVVGEEWHIGDQTYRSSVIRFAKDAQVLYNYGRSVGAEVMGQQTLAPWMVTPRQVANLEVYWAQPNRASAYLPYNPDPEAPPPQRIQPAVPSSAVMSEISLASEDMKATTGIYDASLGARSNETSGIAIQQRQQESEASTSSYADNMVKSITHTGRVILDMIPEVYDAQRAVRILGPDDEEKAVMINAVMEDVNGRFIANDMRVGKYEARVSVGPSYQSKREESASGMFEFMRAIPNAAPAVADLVAAAQDWPDSDRVAERLKKMLPPGMEDDGAQNTPEAQQQAMMMMQQQQQAAMLQQQLEMIQLQEAQAKAAQSEAQARKAQADAEKSALEVAKLRLEVETMAGISPAFPAPQYGA